MARNSLIHPQDRLLQIPPSINLQQGKFFISTEEFEGRLNAICSEIWEIRQFYKFAVDNFKKIEERHLICEDIKIFVDYISVCTKKEFADLKSMFKKTCRQFPFEFLLIFDLCREIPC